MLISGKTDLNTIILASLFLHPLTHYPIFVAAFASRASRLPCIPKYRIEYHFTRYLLQALSLGPDRGVAAKTLDSKLPRWFEPTIPALTDLDLATSLHAN